MKNKCPKGKPCGNTCIERSKTCKVEIRGSLSELIALASGQIRGVHDPERYQDWNVEASGFYGIVSFSPDGSRAVKQLIDRNDGKGGFGPHEVDIGIKMAQLNHSPKIFSHSSKHIEMERIPGKPLWKNYQRQEGEEPMNSAQAKNASSAIRDLHKMGFYHGDMHNKQFIVDGDKVKLIDFGMSQPALSNPRRVMQDLNKISPLVNWDNPDLDGDPYVQLVRKYRKLYRNTPSRKKAEKEEYERGIGLQYLEELKSI